MEAKTLNTAISWVLVGLTLVFVLLLAGVGSGALTDDPPAISPYATGSPATTTTTAAVEPAATDTTTAAPPEPAGPAVITIEGFAFSDPISVATGQAVVVTNNDGALHTWTDRDGAFNAAIDGNDSFEFTFAAAGEYEFFCSIHPSMTGSISVTG